MRLNSVIFHTDDLEGIRSFYEGKLSFPTGTYKRGDQELSDFSESYVNYYIEGTLLFFEKSTDQTDLGTIVINTTNFSKLKNKFLNLDIKIVGDDKHWLKIKDPDGRSIIFEPLP